MSTVNHYLILYFFISNKIEALKVNFVATVKCIYINKEKVVNLNLKLVQDHSPFSVISIDQHLRKH